MMVPINTILNHKTKTYFLKFDKNILRARTFFINDIVNIDFYSKYKYYLFIISSNKFNKHTIKN